MSPVRKLRAASEGNATPISNAVIVAMVVVALTGLTYVGKVNGDAAISLFSAIIGALLARQSFSAGSKATSDPPPDA